MNLERIDSAPAHMAGYSSATDFGLTWAARQAQADFEAAEQFREECAASDAHTAVMWAPTRSDYDAPHIPGTERPQRPNKLGELMHDALDYRSGPSVCDAMQLILAAAKSSDEALAKQAKAMIDRMSIIYATYHAPEVE